MKENRTRKVFFLLCDIIIITKHFIYIRKTGGVRGFGVGVTRIANHLCGCRYFFFKVLALYVIAQSIFLSLRRAKAAKAVVKNKYVIYC